MRKTCSVFSTGQRFPPASRREHSNSARPKHQSRIKTTTGLRSLQQPEPPPPPPQRVSSAATPQQCCKRRRERVAAGRRVQRAVRCGAVRCEQLSAAEPGPQRRTGEGASTRGASWPPLCELPHWKSSSAESGGRSGFTCMLLICVQNGF